MTFEVGAQASSLSQSVNQARTQGKVLSAKTKNGENVVKVLTPEGKIKTIKQPAKSTPARNEKKSGRSYKKDKDSNIGRKKVKSKKTRKSNFSDKSRKNKNNRSSGDRLNNNTNRPKGGRPRVRNKSNKER